MNEYECPWCEEQTPAPPDGEELTECVHCGAELEIDYDADITTEGQRDLTCFRLVSDGRKEPRQLRCDRCGASGGCGPMGCLSFILGLWFLILFVGGACAADPAESGMGHDMQQGLNAIFRPIRTAWEAAR